MMIPTRFARLLLAVLLTGGAARAGGLRDPEAERLFREGTALLERGELAGACEKLDAASKREDDIHVLGLLALCHERIGRPGKAWNEFRRIEPRVPPGEKAAFVARHLKALEASVARAPLDVGDATILEVRVDREPAVLDGGRLVTDPGEHTISVEAGGKARTRNVTLQRGDNAPIVMIDVAPPRRASPPAAPNVSGTRPIGGYALAGVGAIGLGLGAYFGLRTFALHDEARQACGAAGTIGSTTTCLSDSDKANAKERQASDFALASTIAFAGGAVMAALGVVLIVTGGDARSGAISTGRAHVVPSIGPAYAGLSGAF
jgi:hypothetical protein